MAGGSESSKSTKEIFKPDDAINDQVQVLTNLKRPEEGFLYFQRQLLMNPPWTDGDPVKVEIESHTKESGEVVSVERKYIVHNELFDYSTTGLMPLHSDWLFLMCILKDIQQNIRSDRIPLKYKTSFYQILDKCRYADNGKNYAMVRESLSKKWSNVQVHTVQYDKKGKRSDDYHGLLNVLMDERSIEISFDPKWMSKFGQALVDDAKLINFTYRTALKTSKARRLIDFIDGAIEDKEGVIEMPAKDWKKQLNLAPKYPSQIYNRIKDTISYINRELPGLGIIIDPPDEVANIRVTVGCRKERIPDTPARSFLKLIDELSSDVIKNSKKVKQMIYNIWLNDETKATLDANMTVALLNNAEEEDRTPRLAEGILAFLIAGKGYDWLDDAMAYCIERKHAKRKKPLEDFEVYFFKIARDGDLDSWRAKREKKLRNENRSASAEENEKSKDQNNNQHLTQVRDAYSDAIDAYIGNIPQEDLIAEEQNIIYTATEKTAMSAMKEEHRSNIRQVKLRAALERKMLLDFDKSLLDNRDEIIQNAQIFMNGHDASFLEMDITKANPFTIKQITEELFINWLRAAYMYQYCQNNIQTISIKK